MDHEEFKEKIQYQHPAPGIVDMVLPSGYTVRNLVFPIEWFEPKEEKE